MKLRFPRSRAGRVILALILLNELRGLIVVGMILLAAKGVRL